jgi:hypothetical protein
MTKARDIASAAPAPSTVSATELGYLDGVSSAIQTQIDSKIGSASAINPTIVDAKGDIIAATAADTVARLAVGANNTVLTADSSTATGLKWAAVAAGGKVLQVVYGSTSTGVSSTTATYVDTGLSASITPTLNTSKVLVLVNHQECAKTGDTRMRMKLLRGATDILQIAQNMGNSNSGLYYQWASMSASYLDEPSTTSSTTYKTQFNNQDATGTTYVNGSGTCVSTIVLIEIGA